MPYLLARTFLFLGLFFTLMMLPQSSQATKSAKKQSQIEAAQMHYQVEINQPQHHLAQITLEMIAPDDLLVLKMPAWRTGKYQLINQANGVRNFSASGQQNKSLKWQRTDKSSWQIETRKGDKVSVSYQVYANELATRSRHIDSTHAYLDGVAVYLYSPQTMQQQHKINLQVPAEWKSYSGMQQLTPHSFVAKNYHQLASSPIETGINQLREFKVLGIDYKLVVWGEGNYNLDKMATDIQTLVSQAESIWLAAPFENYLFIVHATSGAKGATEHINSTVIQKQRYSFAKREDYLSFLRTAAHEFIHSWNVKAYRPQGLVPYNYQQENYSPLLWVAEGSTSYFQNRLLLTAGLQTVKEYLKDLAYRIDKFKTRPGTKQQSISDASFEQWIAQGGDFAQNHSVNIYSEGFMASWLLDLQLLQDSNLQAGYKELHNKLYALGDYKSDAYRQSFALGYSANDMREIAQDLTGNNYNDWWKKHIESPLQLDFESMLSVAGLKFSTLNKKDYKIWTGFSFDSKASHVKLTRVEHNSPAWQAGLTSGDIIIAIDNMRATPKLLEKHLKQYKPDDEIKISLFRNDQLLNLSLTLSKRNNKPVKIEALEKTNEQQQEFFKTWLGVDFPEPD